VQKVKLFLSLPKTEMDAKGMKTNFFTRATVGCSLEIFIQEKQIPKTQKS
jgi:hypothetical protein